MFTLSALELHELEAAARLLPAERAANLGHLRWCLRTPYVQALALRAFGELHAVVTLLRASTSVQVLKLLLPTGAARGERLRQLAEAVVQQHDKNVPLLVQCDPRDMHAWEALGLREQGAFDVLGGGTFVDASRDEIALQEPSHTLALLHLHQQATAEDHRALLLEHRFAAHAWADGHKVQGVLLPLLGHGLIVADAPAVGLELQRWLLPAQPRIVVPEANTAAHAHLLDCDYDVLGSSVRLVLGHMPAWKPEMVFAWPWV